MDVETLSIDRLTEAWPWLDLVKIDAESPDRPSGGMRESVTHQSIAVSMEFNAEW